MLCALLKHARTHTLSDSLSVSHANIRQWVTGVRAKCDPLNSGTLPHEVSRLCVCVHVYVYTVYIHTSVTLTLRSFGRSSQSSTFCLMQ